MCAGLHRQRGEHPEGRPNSMLWSDRQAQAQLTQFATAVIPKGPIEFTLIFRMGSI